LEHSIHVHPKWHRVLQVKATFINYAPFPQPFPELQLSFEDINAQTVAQRRFKPHEYLLHPAEAEQPIPSKTRVKVYLEFIDNRAIIKNDLITLNYHFDFL